MGLPGAGRVFAKILGAGLHHHIGQDPLALWNIAKAHLSNLQTKPQAAHDVSSHYDIGNGLYEQMLDERMLYTCAYWEQAATLEEAQVNRMELICQKLQLAPGQRVLDIGCGWGGFARYAAKHYQVHVTGITISAEQAKLARKNCAGLPVDIRLQDYRDVHEPFDRIVFIGMFEHVGYKNYATYMDVVHRNLTADGISLLHTIGGNETSVPTDEWIKRYIFPNGLLPSAAQIGRALEGRFVLEDWHNFGLHYDRTLLAWFDNFDRAWPTLRATYGKRFYCMWTYYLKMCAGSFRSRNINLWQLVLVKRVIHESTSPSGPTACAWP